MKVSAGRFIIIAATATIAAALALSVLRTPALPSVDAAGTCPRDEVLARLNPEIDGSVRSQRQRTGSPVRPDLPLYRDSSLTAQVDRRPSGRGDSLIVMVGATLGTVGPALVRRIRDDVCGWMDVRDLEKSATRPTPIRLPGFGASPDAQPRWLP